MNSLLKTVIKESIINSNWRKKALERIDPTHFDPEDILDFCLGPQEPETAGDWPEHLANYLIELAVKESGLRERIYSLLETHKNEDAVIDWLANLSIQLASLPEPCEPWLRRCWVSMMEIQKNMLEKENEHVWKSSTWETILDFIRNNGWPEEMVGFVSIISEIETIEAIDFLRSMYMIAPEFGSWKRSIRQQFEFICAKRHDSDIVQERACQVIEELKRMENA